MKSAFLDKLLERLDRLDPESLQNQFIGLIQERGLLETIFQSIKEGVIVVDGDGKMTYANRAAEELLGFTISESRGRPVSSELREIDWYRVLDVGDSEWSKLISREIEITYPQNRIVNVYAVPLAPEGDGGDGAVIILRDITHERMKEESLLESERIDAVKLLAAGVAHEIGNPLNALHIHLQLLEREIRELPNEQVASLKELVEVAGAEIQRLDLTISQFLKAIRPSEPNLEVSNIDQLLEETLLLLKLEIQHRKIDVQIERLDTLPSIKVDPDQMKQVFFNVTKNAFQAMPDGGSLRISLTSSDEFLGVVFLDSGIGIDPEDLGRIFEPYHTTKSEGSGLGLMVVQRIVQDHGGQIEIESKPGEGTRFTILLPLAEKRVRLLRSSSTEASTSGVADVDIPNEAVR